MSDLARVYQSLSIDPNFAKLPYPSQQHVRQALVSRLVGSTPGFAQLSPVVRNRVTQRLVNAPPVLQDSKASYQFQQLAQAADQGDEKALGTLEALWRQTRVRRTNLLGNLAMKAYQPVVQGAAPGGVEAQAAGLDEHLIGSDSDRIQQYLATRAMEPGSPYEGMARRVGAVEFAAGIAGSFALFGPGPNLVGNVAGLAALARVSKSASALASVVRGSVVPQLVETGTASLLGLVQENAMAMLTRDPARYTDSIKEVGTALGQGAVSDFLFGMATRGPLQALGTMLKGVFKGYRPAQIAQAGLSRAFEELAGGTNLAPELRRMQPAADQASAWMSEQSVRITRQGLEDLTLRPEDRTILAANALGGFQAGGVDFRRLDDGRYELFLHDTSGGTRVTTHGTYSTLDELQDRIAREAWVRASRFSPAEQATFLQGNAWLWQRGKTLAEVDSLASGRAASEIGQPITGRAIPADSRPYVGLEEADAIAQRVSASGGIAFRADLGQVSEGQVKRFLGQASIIGPEEGARAFSEAAQGSGFVVIKRLADEGTLKKAQAYAQSAIARGSTETAERLTRGYLLEAGFDGVRLADDSVLALVPSHQAKLVVGSVDKLGKIDRYLPGAEPQRVAGLRMTTGEVLGRGELRRSPEKAAQALQGVFYGNVDGKRAEGVLRLALDSEDSLKGYRFEATAKGATLEVDDAKKIVRYPARISTPQEQRALIQSVMNTSQARALSGAGGPGAGIMIASKTHRAVAALKPASFLRPFSGADQQVRATWLAAVARENGGDLSFDALSGQWTLKARGVTPLTTKSLDEVHDALADVLLDEATVTAEAASAGWRVSKEGDRLVLQRGDTRVSGDTPAAAARAAGLTDLRVSNRYAPRTVIVSPSKIAVQYDGNVISGRTADILKRLNGFVDLKEAADYRPVLGGPNGKIYRSYTHGGIRLEMPQLASSIDFEDVASARTFLKDAERGHTETLRKVAFRKGLELRYDAPSSRYVLSDGSGVQHLSNLQDVRAALKRTPDAVGIQDVFAADPNFSAEARSLWEEYAKANPKMAREWIATDLDADLRGWSYDTHLEEPRLESSNEAIRTMRSQLEEFRWWKDKTLGKSELAVPELKRRVDQVLSGLTAQAVDQGRTTDVLMAIFREDQTGFLGRQKHRVISLERRQKILHFMEVEPGSRAWADAEKAFGALGDSDLRRVEQIRELLGSRSGTITTGLTRKYGISWREYVDSYISRVRTYTDEIKGVRLAEESLTADELLVKITPDLMPSRVNPFFQNMRTGELVDAARDTDALSVLLRYTSQGNKAIHLNNAWRELNAYMHQNAKAIPRDVVERLKRFQYQALGLWHPPSVQAAEDVGVGLMRMFGASERDALRGKNILKTYFSLSYAGMLGFRPISAVRNALQISFHGARFGNDWMRRAVIELDGRGAGYISRLRQLGVIPPTPPVVNELLTETSRIGRFTTKAMGWFKNADEFSRAVSYLATDLRFSEAVDKLRAGVFKGTAEEMTAQFERYAGLHLIKDTNPEVVAGVLKTLQDGKLSAQAVDQARYLFGAETVRQTMGDWHATNSPALFSSGLLGKLFGRLGSYSAIYRSNIYRGLRNGSRADKLAFLGRFLANNLAIKGVLTGLGIASADFTPGQPALFGGGPDFDLAVALLKSPSSGYKGAQARAELLRMVSPFVFKREGGQITGLRFNVPSLLPGSMHFRFLEKADQAISQGDWYRAFLAGTMTPATPVQE